MAQPTWPPDAAGLLAELLGRFQGLSRPAVRGDLLARMDDAAAMPPRAGAPSFRLDVPHHDKARDHLAAIVQAVRTRRDPVAALDALTKALRAGHPGDRALPWLELAVCGLTGASPLPPGPAIGLVQALFEVTDPPPPDRLVRHVPYDAPGTGQLTGGETLPEILLRLSDRRRGEGREPLLRFLHAVAYDETLAAHAQLDALRTLLTALGAPAAPVRAAEARSRLIVQIRVEACGAPHVEDEWYQLWGSYYRQPADGGPLTRVRTLEPTEPFRRSELTDVGSARLSGWRELARDVRGASGGVRVEFLLPAALLGHCAELWSLGPSRTPVGRHHPVVVRSLERYSDHWLDQRPWQRRWDHLCDDGPYPDALDRIEWPPLDGDPMAGLARLLAHRPELACLGLAEPYDRLTARHRDAVHDALWMEGVPVMVWRRGDGEPGELMDALRRHAPPRLRDLPETVHHCRKQGRTCGDTDVRNNITLLWDDPSCVDADQDLPFAGMA